MPMKDRDIPNHIRKPARYIGMEHNAYYKDFYASDIRVCLCFPDIYEIGMSTLAVNILYSLLNEQPNVCCDRAFLPWNDMQDFLKENNNTLCSLEGNIPLNEFDVVGMSISYEMNYTNFLQILSLGKIPLKSCDRKDSAPIILVGGPGVYNPEPIANFADAIFIGEAEEGILEIVDAILKFKKEGLTRLELLSNLAKIESVYVPSLYKPIYKRRKNSQHVYSLEPIDSSAEKCIKKRSIENLDNAFFPIKQIVPLVDTVHNRAQVEIMRGCPWKCRYCQAGFTYGNVRTRSEEKILELSRKTIAATGFDELSFLSLSTGTYGNIENIIKELSSDFKKQGVGMSLPSLRIEPKIESFPKLLSYVKRTGLTLAPEAGSQRLRDVIGKKLDIDDLKKCVATASQMKWRRIKLYFMIGLPTETMTDIDELCDLVNEIARIFRSGGNRASEVAVSIGNFIPKPHTPFQWCGMQSIESLLEKQEYIRGKIVSKGVKLSFHNPKVSFVEAFLSRADRTAGEVIYTAFLNGATLQAWDDFFNFSIWKDVFDKLNFDADFFVHENRPTSESLAWSHIKCSTNQETLAKEYQTAISNTGCDLL